MSRIGVDESGKGDYFGPLVVAACYVDEDIENKLAGVLESKRLTDASALKWAEKIKSVAPYSIHTLMPEKYNAAYAKLKNLNTMLAYGHARCIEDLLDGREVDKVVSDQFGDPKLLRSLLHQRGCKTNFVSMVRAESDLAVAAASVIARAEFLLKLRELSEKFEIGLPKGATTVIPTALKFVKAYGAEKLGEVAKTHFKTTKKVLNQL
jgi:ribonuclease HIII